VSKLVQQAEKENSLSFKAYLVLPIAVKKCHYIEIVSQTLKRSVRTREVSEPTKNVAPFSLNDNTTFFEKKQLELPPSTFHQNS